MSLLYEVPIVNYPRLQHSCYSSSIEKHRGIVNDRAFSARPCRFLVRELLGLVVRVVTGALKMEGRFGCRI